MELIKKNLSFYREKPQLGITCNCGKLSHKKCSPDDGKFNIPEDVSSICVQIFYNSRGMFNH